MKVLSRLIFILLLAALAFWPWTILFPSPEKIIRKRLLSMAGNISFSQNENNLLKMVDAQHVADFFTDNVTVDLTLPGRVQQSSFDREEITQAMLVSRQQATDIQMKFPDINVTVAPDKNSAVADVTLDATISGEHDAILQEIKFTFEKVNGQWLINKVETVRVLS